MQISILKMSETNTFENILHLTVVKFYVHVLVSRSVMGNKSKTAKYLWFKLNISEQLYFSLAGFVSERAQQIQSVWTFAAHDFRQLILLGHLQIQTIKSYQEGCRASGRQFIGCAPSKINKPKGKEKNSHQQAEALCNFERVFLFSPCTLEDGVAHDVDGVRAAQATQVDEGHRCSGTCSNRSV
jgi:hypothetical protein